MFKSQIPISNFQSLNFKFQIPIFMDNESYLFYESSKPRLCIEFLFDH